jgi:membrane-associated phospholipid phosphatase
LSTSLSVAYPKWYVIAPAYTWAAGVAYSRLALGAHYPSDVLAGAIIGSGSAWLNIKLNQWLNKKSKPQ